MLVNYFLIKKKVRVYSGDNNILYNKSVQNFSNLIIVLK